MGLFSIGRVSVATIIFALVCVASLLGILTRPLGQLASLWPANALLLGAMVRFPNLATRYGWAAAVAAYFAADLVTGGHFFTTVILTAGNLAGVVTGFLLYQRFSPEHRNLQESSSVLSPTHCCSMEHLLPDGYTGSSQNWPTTWPSCRLFWPCRRCRRTAVNGGTS